MRPPFLTAPMPALPLLAATQQIQKVWERAGGKLSPITPRFKRGNDWRLSNQDQEMRATGVKQQAGFRQRSEDRCTL